MEVNPPPSNGGPEDGEQSSEDHSICESAISLRDEVLELIAPYRTTASPSHPFTTEELVVIAAIALGKQACTRQQICRYILTNFYKYMEKVIDAACYEATKPFSWICECGFPRLDGFETAFGCYQVPLRPAHEKNDLLEVVVQNWAVDFPAARIFLGRHLAPPEGPFRILALPAELRVVIYEYALSYPALSVDLCESTGCRFCPFDPERPDLQTHITPDILSITRVNRQMYREALPVFYAVNHFDLRGPWKDHQLAFVRMLRESDPLATPERKSLCVNASSISQYITSIDIDYHWGVEPYRAVTQQLIEYLLGVRRLKRLSVHLVDEQWHGWFDPKSAAVQSLGHTFSHPRELPAMGKLVRLVHRAEDCELRGDENGQVVQHIRSEVERLKNETHEPGSIDWCTPVIVEPTDDGKPQKARWRSRLAFVSIFTAQWWRKRAGMVRRRSGNHRL